MNTETHQRGICGKGKVLGWSKSHIAVEKDTPLFGYPKVERKYNRTGEKESLLQISVILFRQGKKDLLLWIFIECCLILPEDDQFLRARISDEFKIEKANIWISCTHTHSAPLPRWVESQSEIGHCLNGFGDLENVKCYNYGESLLSTALKTVENAYNSLKPAQVVFKQTRNSNGYNRRVIVGGKLKHCWNPKEQTELHPESANDLFNSGLLFKSETSDEVCYLQSVGIHPVVLGSSSQLLSGDWPQALREQIESKVSNATINFCLDASAEIHPLYATQSDPAMLKEVADCFKDNFSDLVECDSLSKPEICWSLESHEFCYGNKSIKLSIFDLGECLIVALPLEISAKLAGEIRKVTNLPIIFATITNGWNGYWMHPDDYPYGGYEIELAQFVSIKSIHTNDLKIFLCKKIQNAKYIRP